MATFCRQCSRVISTAFYIRLRVCRQCRLKAAKVDSRERDLRIMEKRPNG